MQADAARLRASEDQAAPYSPDSNPFGMRPAARTPQGLQLGLKALLDGQGKEGAQPSSSKLSRLSSSAAAQAGGADEWALKAGSDAPPTGGSGHVVRGACKGSSVYGSSCCCAQRHSAAQLMHSSPAPFI